MARRRNAVVALVGLVLVLIPIACGGSGPPAEAQRMAQTPKCGSDAAGYRREVDSYLRVYEALARQLNVRRQLLNEIPIPSVQLYRRELRLLAHSDSVNTTPDACRAKYGFSGVYRHLAAAGRYYRHALFIWNRCLSPRYRDVCAENPLGLEADLQHDWGGGNAEVHRAMVAAS